MLQIKPTRQRGPVTTGSDRSGLDLEKLHRKYLHDKNKAVIRPTIKHE